MAERGSDRHGPRLDDDLHDDPRSLDLDDAEAGADLARFLNLQEVWVALGGMVEHHF